MSLVDFILRVLQVFIFLFFILLVIVAIIDIATSKVVGTEEVPCYDKKGNEVIGLKCEEEIRCSSVIKWLRVYSNDCGGGE